MTVCRIVQYSTEHVLWPELLDLAARVFPADQRRSSADQAGRQAGRLAATQEQQPRNGGARLAGQPPAAALG